MFTSSCTAPNDCICAHSCAKGCSGQVSAQRSMKQICTRETQTQRLLLNLSISRLGLFQTQSCDQFFNAIVWNLRCTKRNKTISARWQEMKTRAQVNVSHNMSKQQLPHMYNRNMTKWQVNSIQRLSLMPKILHKHNGANLWDSIHWPESAMESMEKLKGCGLEWWKRLTYPKMIVKPNFIVQQILEAKFYRPINFGLHILLNDKFWASDFIER